MPFKDFSHVLEVDCGDFPHNCHIYVGVVVGNDIPHSPHFPLWQLIQNFAGFIREMRCGFTNNFNSPNDRVMFFTIPEEILFRNCSNVGLDTAHGFEDVSEPRLLLNVHGGIRPSRE